jgi:hypothetical protein
MRVEARPEPTQRAVHVLSGATAVRRKQTPGAQDAYTPAPRLVRYSSRHLSTSFSLRSRDSRACS